MKRPNRFRWLSEFWESKKNNKKVSQSHHNKLENLSEEFLAQKKESRPIARNQNGREEDVTSLLPDDVDLSYWDGLGVDELDSYPPQEWLAKKSRKGSSSAQETEESLLSQRNSSQTIVQRSSSGNPIYIKSHQGSHKQERAFPVYELSGSLELIGGLILTGVDTHLSISRVVHNKVIDKGDLIIEDGIYKMFASDLKGHIVATLYNTQDEILGTGKFNLYKLPEQAKKSSQIDKLHIKVKPL